MTGTAVAAYRALLRLYPREFRDEYGVDMALLFAHQLRDEPPGRVCARSLVDLARTIPTRHLEAHMKHAPGPGLPLTVTALSVTAVAVAIIGGTDRGVLVVALPVAVLSTLFAVSLWHDTRPVAVPHDTTARWWKYLAGGAGLLIALIVTTTATGELPEGLWLPTMAAFLLAIVLTVIGVVLALAHVAAGRQRNAPG